jgi:hypothetical protein
MTGMVAALQFAGFYRYPKSGPNPTLQLVKQNDARAAKFC